MVTFEYYFLDFEATTGGNRAFSHNKPYHPLRHLPPGSVEGAGNGNAAFGLNSAIVIAYIWPGFCNVLVYLFQFAFLVASFEPKFG